MKDIYLASVVSILFSLMLLMKWRFPQALEFLSMFGRPAGSIFVLVCVAFLYIKGFILTSLILSILSIYLLKTIWITWPRSDEKRLFLEINRDQKRFLPENSIDLQIANKTVSFDPPDILAPPLPFPELLIFPPSSQTLYELCG